MDAEETEKERLKLQSKANRAKSTDRVIKTQHIQKDLLLEALDTEVNYLIHILLRSISNKI